jgi:SAM-dependent methyltransferase
MGDPAMNDISLPPPPASLGVPVLSTLAGAPGQALVRWSEGEAGRSAVWRSSRNAGPPRRLVMADDTLPADTAYRLACEGCGLVWQGDFQNARLLLQALARRLDKPPRARKPHAAPAGAPAAPQVPLAPIAPTAPADAAAGFHRYRQARAHRARVLGMVLVAFDADYRVPLRRAPDVRIACAEAWGMPAADAQPSLASLRELLGIISAHEWRKKGIAIAALGMPPGNRIHPHYGVFSPVRGEYIDLVAQAPLPPAAQGLAFDIGTGTGVLAAVLARRGVARVVATDVSDQALACAAANLGRLGLGDRVGIVRADLFPPGRAGLVVCNPPWLPARPGSPLEQAVYDEGGRMLLGFLNGAAAHLLPGGQAWLVLSDLAEHLGLRPRGELLAAIAQAGLRVLGRLDAAPRHPKASDASDPLHAARSMETTSLWQLAAA